MANDDALIFADNTNPDIIDALNDETDAQSDDPDSKAHHIHHPQRYASHPLSENPDTPGPRRTPLQLDPDLKKVNGRYLTNATRDRDRDMLNR